MDNNSNNNRARNRAQHIQNKMSQVEKPRIKLSRDPNKAMEEVMITIHTLKNFLVKETAALKDANTKLFLELQDEKLYVARDYLEGMSQLIGRKEELKTANEAIKDRLEILRNEFGEIAADNHAAISRMKNGMKRLSDRIMEAARETARRDRQIIYGASGRMQSAGGGTIGISESA